MINLALLTEFDESLVLDFEPERSLNPEMGMQGSYKLELHSLAQREDLYNAYRYIQEGPLVWLREQGIANSAFTDKMLEGWVHQIHRLIADSIGKDQGIEAGNYIDPDTCIYRWNPGADLHNMITLALGRDHGYAYNAKSENFTQYVKGMSQVIAQLYSMNADDLYDFFMIALQYQNEVTIPANNDDKVFTQSRGEFTLALLTEAYWKGNLSEAQKIKIRKIVKIGNPPHLVYSQIATFMRDTVSDWKRCDKNNLKAVSEFAAKTFYELTEIHPYFNCNGRTATCMVNLILRSYGYPSILIRFITEKSDENSLYSKAIKGLEEGNLTLLAELIQNRVEQKQQGIINPISVPQKKLNILNLEIGYLCRAISTEFKEFDLQTFFKKQCVVELEKMYEGKDTLEEASECSIGAATTVVSRLQKQYHILKLMQDKTIITRLKKNLSIISGSEAWDMNVQLGLKAWCVVERKNAPAIEEQLKAYGVTKSNPLMLKYADDTLNCILITVDELDVDKIMASEKSMDGKLQLSYHPALGVNFRIRH